MIIRNVVDELGINHLIKHFVVERAIIVQHILIFPIFTRNVADELRIFESINHPHLINHFGVEIHREEMLIFMEYCPEVRIDIFSYFSYF